MEPNPHYPERDDAVAYWDRYMEATDPVTKIGCAQEIYRLATHRYVYAAGLEKTIVNLRVERTHLRQVIKRQRDWIDRFKKGSLIQQIVMVIYARWKL